MTAEDRGLLTPRQIWTQDKPTDRMAWAVCPYNHLHLPEFECQRCPDAEFILDHDEPSTRFCRSLAEETCRVVLAAKEHLRK